VEFDYSGTILGAAMMQMKSDLDGFDGVLTRIPGLSTQLRFQRSRRRGNRAVVLRRQGHSPKGDLRPWSAVFPVWIKNSSSRRSPDRIVQSLPRAIARSKP